MFCASCGTKNDSPARFCRSCGAALDAPAGSPVSQLGTMRGVAAGGAARPATRRGEKNPVLAAILSLVVVGVGQLYNGDWKKGLAMLGGVLVLAVPTAGLAWVGIAVWSVIDAYRVAKGEGRPW